MLLLFPFTEKHHLNKFPVGLVTLMVIILGVFLFLQWDDSYYRNKAEDYYFNSGLYKIEFPLYFRYLRKNLSIDEYYEQVEILKNKKMKKNELYWLQRTDPFFQYRLKSGLLINHHSSWYWKWNSKRREYDYLLSKDTVETYGFKTAEPKLMDAFLSLFMHGNWGHLISNLIFLFFVGLCVESIFGVFGLIACFLITGLMALSMHALIYPLSVIPIVGASGALSGLMGVYLAYFGMRKVTFFYNVLFYFNFMKAPAILLLPLWIGWEFSNYYFGKVNDVAYFAHLGGLLSGALIGLYFRFIVNRKENKKIDIKGEPFQEPHLSDYQKKLKEAKELLSHMEYVEALKILNELNEEYPGSPEILYQLFNATKIEPYTDDYHNVVAEIFALKYPVLSSVSIMNTVFKHYIKRAEPTIKYDLNVFLRLSRRFRKCGYLENVEQILNVLIKNHTDRDIIEEIAREQFLLAKIYIDKNDRAKAIRLLDSITILFPETESASQAKGLQTILGA